MDLFIKYETGEIIKSKVMVMRHENYNE